MGTMTSRHASNLARGLMQDTCTDERKTGYFPVQEAIAQRANAFTGDFQTCVLRSGLRLQNPRWKKMQTTKS
eukprot:2773787-Pleurochrysis_carterae.AAC.2